jgi:hypothetical protein
MSDSFKDREAQAEAKFVHDEELRFKIVAHRNKLFAIWVADQMGEAAPPEYAAALVEYAFGRTDADLLSKASGDLHDHGVAVADIKIHKALDQLEQQAHTEVMTALPIG